MVPSSVHSWAVLKDPRSALLKAHPMDSPRVLPTARLKDVDWAVRSGGQMGAPLGSNRVVLKELLLAQHSGKQSVGYWEVR